MIKQLVVLFLITGLWNSAVGSGDFERRNRESSSYIELKDPPILRVTPISLFDLDYSSQENVYEEMDELLKLKQKSSFDKNGGSKKRGDMDPTDYSLLEDKIDDKVPVRGDIVTRNKRSHNYDAYNDDDDDNDDEYDDDHYDDDDDNDNKLWGFSESDGLDLITKDYDNKPVKEFKNKLSHRSDYDEQLERKLKDYIERNRPKKIDRNNYGRFEDLPVAARIIIDRNKQLPVFPSRNNFDERDVDFPEIHPTHKGIQVKNFPAARPPANPTSNPPPGACVWAIVTCCPRPSSTTKGDVDRRVINCFENMACPGVANWNPTLCWGPIASNARKEILNYYSRS